MASVVVNGDTSGAVTLSAPAVAGTVTVTLPSASGTMALTSNISAATATALGTVYGATPASNNVALGYNSGTGGSYNTFTGNTAGQNITGSFNNAYGQAAFVGASPFTANRNDAFGYASLSAVTSGAYNACFGFLTGLSTTSGQNNTAVGASALQANTTASNNVAVGFQAGYSVTTGGVNTFVGRYAGYYVTTGINNTVLGGFNGNQGGLDIRTASNHIVLSDGDGNPRGIFNNNGYFLVGRTSVSSTGGGSFVQTPSLTVEVGSDTTGAYWNRTDSSAAWVAQRFNAQGSLSGYIQVNTSSVTYSTTSDYRLKENIAPMIGALEKVLQLKPVTYKWKVNGMDGQGFIAHELQAVVPDCVTGEKDKLDANGNPEYQGVDTSFLVATLTAAIQELSAKVQALEAQLNQGA